MSPKTPSENAPFYEGPKPYVRIPDNAFGPVFISQNHSPAITECPNGDLLAVWFSTMGETDLTTANAASRLRLGKDEWELASPFWDAQDVNDHAPKIWWDGGHTIFHIVEGRQHGDILLRCSTDNGVTWSKAEVMRARGESAGNPIRTAKGVIAIPFDFSGLSISRDNGRTWRETGRDRRGMDDIRPGGKGPFIAGIHSPIVELADGRLMAYARLSAEEPAQKRFDLRMPVSYSSDLGETWQWEVSEFPIVSNTLFGLLSAEKSQHELFTLQGASRWTRLIKLQFPAALPNIFVGLRISAGLAVIGAVVGDFYFRQGGVVGIGAQIDVYRNRLWGAELITAIIMASVLGLVVFLFFGWLSRAAIGKWHITTRGQ
jgi:hypothetical protein